ncbi:exodeoxyribonuclease VII large subunit [Rhodobacter sp. KR11]|nr:exodeoxyribonuclease VII large subunit [Rhodobacter sp. KR11]MCW1919822.1 exodeoxyribonuclease VII large subunit [Rhodobacter sp. KR11]
MLFEDDTPAPNPAKPGPGNQPEYTVSELSGAVKRVIEGEFGLIRVRGEIGRVSRPASGHLYFDLKDDRNVIAAISWKGQVARMSIRPTEGMEVVATGKMTTFPGQSKYQLIVDDMAPAGAGALMAMLEKRKAALQAEGLFDPARKKPIPYLPRVIGVVTSPSGAVIRDILHRLADRFPRHVLVWPVAVQGEKCPAEVAAAIRGFNALQPGGHIPRPDLIIVARGGGSMEDLMGFNDEAVVRAAAASLIPLISAVGHETDTTLIDYASDRRAPTPTAAAEMAVPVRADLLAALADLNARLSRSQRSLLDRRAQRLADLGRALPRLDALLASPRQRLDAATQRLGAALSLAAQKKRSTFAALATRHRPLALLTLTARKAETLKARAATLDDRATRRLERATSRLDLFASRLAPSLGRLITGAARDIARDRARLSQAAKRLDGFPKTLATLALKLDALNRTRQTLGHAETLARGFAILRVDGHVVTSAQTAARAPTLEIELHDGRLTVHPHGDPDSAQPGAPKPGAAQPGAAQPPQSRKPKSTPPKSTAAKPEKPGQGSLF